MKNSIKEKLDLLGMSVSLLCALHCAVVPIILTIGVFQKFEWLDSPLLEVIFIITSLAVAGYSLTRSYLKVHNSIVPLVIAIIGFLIFFTGLYDGAQYHIILRSIGGIIVLLSHLLNFRMLHQR